jgi:hypothetical protein
MLWRTKQRAYAQVPLPQGSHATLPTGTTRNSIMWTNFK